MINCPICGSNKSPEQVLRENDAKALKSVHRSLLYHQEEETYFVRVSAVLKIVLLATIIFLFVRGCDNAYAESYDVEAIADAIYLAEGGAKAKKPYGILSVSCHGEEECRDVCMNTIEANFTRWQAAGGEGDFLEFLAGKYAPIGASNDRQNLNVNWLKNVRFFLARGGQ